MDREDTINLDLLIQRSGTKRNTIFLWLQPLALSASSSRCVREPVGLVSAMNVFFCIPFEPNRLDASSIVASYFSVSGLYAASL